MTHRIGHTDGSYQPPASQATNTWRGAYHFGMNILRRLGYTPYKTKLAAERVAVYTQDLGLPDGLGEGVVDFLRETVGKHPQAFTVAFFGGSVAVYAFEPTRGFTSFMLSCTGVSYVVGKFEGRLVRIEKVASSLESTQSALEQRNTDLLDRNTELTEEVRVFKEENGKLVEVRGSLEEKVVAIGEAKDAMCEHAAELASKIEEQEALMRTMHEEVEAARGNNTAAAINLQLLETSRMQLAEMKTEQEALLTSIRQLLEQKEALLQQEQELHERRVEKTDEHLGRMDRAVGRLEAASPKKKKLGPKPSQRTDENVDK